MRYKFEELTMENVGEMRIITKFLWLPKIINNEFRWLEYCQIRQVVDFNILLHLDGETKIRKFYWRNTEWVD